MNKTYTYEEIKTVYDKNEDSLFTIGYDGLINISFINKVYKIVEVKEKTFVIENIDGVVNSDYRYEVFPENLIPLKQSEG